jgi:hypothetical protein
LLLAKRGGGQPAAASDESGPTKTAEDVGGDQDKTQADEDDTKTLKAGKPVASPSKKKK